MGERLQKKSDTVDSYGAIILCGDDPGNEQVLLIGSRYGWSFPKGHIEEGETPEAAAIRETKEETGLNISLDTRFCFCVDSARKSEHRNVYFFLGKSLNGIAEPRPSAEVKEAKWVNCTEAFRLVGYLPDRKALQAALDYLAQGN